jgi:hypothetical protein
MANFVSEAVKLLVLFLVHEATLEMEERPIIEV